MTTNTNIILKKIIDMPDDEKTGAHAKRGFRYQDWWSTLKTFEVWSTSNLDFVIGTEVKEDLTILDSLSNPSSLEFYQIKKKETGLWKINDLINTVKRKKAVEKSVLSKLYTRHLDFHPVSTKLYFISNAKLKALDINKKDIEHTNSNFKNDIHSDELNLIDKKLKTQLGLNSEYQIDYSLINFNITKISVDEPDTHVMGKILDLNENSKFPIKLNNIKIAVNYITGQFNQMSSNVDYAINIEQILERCMTRNKFEEIISSVERTKITLEKFMEEGLSELEKEGYPFLKRRKLIQPSREVLLTIRDRSKVDVQELFSLIHQIYLDSIIYLEKLSTISEIMDYLTNEVLKKGLKNFSIEYIKCANLLYIISEGAVYCNEYFNI
ncbi:dsDNA nuclease domain-containing protein [Acinetobacter baumannii]|uniref:dsDNA nuclease domain-containing protein n=2 Tax=Acinetobacter baumannii TaxID=470 RepID=UPI000FEC7CF1|nr:dsDNA nuclease domain-containing protein [Acinetobacter baumannii]MDC5057080.1 dsDNA nuclease domain-containing protein [Acinetobacter baumannii]MDH2613375.1 dsDNA nuclease domain-containing protein [Acinetobacter baumannii]MDH2616935.1 dsDNA nuclease domain-containing protein [Acinetobacter baumannii]QAB41240.1 DUF4297 domain-containing protein [Acinetobacter baumannii]HAV3158697.1 DUF4297 domain-containing protein [Acinetobacter baumannii]